MDKFFNVSVASDRHQQALGGEAAGENLSAEMPFTASADQGQAEIREAPFVFIQNLNARVADNITTHLQ